MRSARGEEDVKEMSKMFAYWSMVMGIELLHCRFVGSLREGDFVLYVQVIDEVCGYVFIWNQTHYSRWLPIHVKDMVIHVKGCTVLTLFHCAS